MEGSNDKKQISRKDIWEKIEKVDEEHGITNAELAKVVGVSESLVERWCGGLSEPRIDKVILIVDLFDVRVDYMLGVID